MGKKNERLPIILGTLEERGAATVNELSEELGVSHMTVRRDIEHLIEDGSVQRYHGGVRPADKDPRSSYDLRTAVQEHYSQKLRIAQYATSLIKPNDIIFLDAGTTTELIARSLPHNRGITVVSTALNIINYAVQTPGVDVISTGGTFHDSSGVFEGPEALPLLGRTRITRAFISANAVQFELGVTCSNQFEVAGKQAAMRSSLEKILVVDSSKLGHVVRSYFADLSEFSRVIIDRPENETIIEECVASGVPFDFVTVDE